MNSDLFRIHFGAEDPATQNELLLMYVDTCADHFKQWLEALVGPPNAAAQQLAQPGQTLGAAPAGKQLLGQTVAPPAAAAPAPAVADTGPSAEAYFTRSLQDAQLQTLPTVSSVSTGERQTMVTASARLDAPYWVWVNNTLALMQAAEGYDPDGGLIAGFKVVFADGAQFALLICNTDEDGIGPFVDCYLRLPDDAPAYLPPSLPPRKRLDEPFVFTIPEYGNYTVHFTQ